MQGRTGRRKKQAQMDGARQKLRDKQHLKDKQHNSFLKRQEWCLKRAAEHNKYVTSRRLAETGMNITHSQKLENLQKPCYTYKLLNPPRPGHKATSSLTRGTKMLSMTEDHRIAAADLTSRHSFDDPPPEGTVTYTGGFNLSVSSPAVVKRHAVTPLRGAAISGPKGPA